MTRLHPKQIDKLVGVRRTLSNAFTLSAGSNINLSGALSGYSPSGSSSAEGVILSEPISLYSHSLGSVITDGLGNQVIGVLNAAFLCTFYISVSGSYSQYTVPATGPYISQVVDIEFSVSVQLDGAFLPSAFRPVNLPTFESTRAPTRTVTADATITMTDFTVRADAAGLTALTLTLPQASTCREKLFCIKKVDSTLASVLLTDPSTTIDGVAVASLLVPFSSITIQSNGLTWDIL